MQSTSTTSQPVEKDFLVPWLGARTFLQYGDSPYGDPATRRRQIVYYGRLAATGQDPLMLWLPLPVELFYFPFALVSDYALAHAIWMTCLEIAMVALGALSLQLTGWKVGRFLLPIFLLLPLFWVYGAFSLVSGSAAGFIGLALVGFLLAVRSERDELAGGLLILMVSAPRPSPGCRLLYLLVDRPAAVAGSVGLPHGVQHPAGAWLPVPSGLVPALRPRRAPAFYVRSRFASTGIFALLVAGGWPAAWLGAVGCPSVHSILCMEKLHPKRLPFLPLDGRPDPVRDTPVGHPNASDGLSFSFFSP